MTKLFASTLVILPAAEAGRIAVPRAVVATCALRCRRRVTPAWERLKRIRSDKGQPPSCLAA